MLSDYITPTLITLCILLVAWYFLGVWFNRRRGIRLARSLRDRLNALGAEELTGRWVNASIFQFVARRATSPIGKLAAIIVLESRELPLIWLVNLLRGRRGARSPSQANEARTRGPAPYCRKRLGTGNGR